MATHVPPQNIEAEESVLGAMLVADPTLTRVIDEVGLESADFYLDRHKLIFDVVVRLYRDGNPVDELTVSEELVQRQAIDKAGGRHYVSELAAKVPAAANAKHYAEIVQENSLLRRLLGAGQEIQGWVNDRKGEPRELFVRAQELLRLSDRVFHDSMFDQERQNTLVWDLLEGRAKAEFFWPFSKLDRLMYGGMRRGQLIIVSGYTNEGKSHFAAQLLDQNRKHGRVCLYDNEMAPEEQAARRTTRSTGVATRKLLQGELTKEERQKVLKHLSGPVHWPIVETAGWTVEEVALHIRQHQWDFVVVDILHNFPFDDERQIAAAVARLKAAARLANCVVVLVAHVNRTGTQGGYRRRPVRSDLKWSGEIENIADVVCFVYRSQDQTTLEPIDSGAIYFDKCRGGELGGVGVTFNKEHALFELDRDEDPEGGGVLAGVFG